MYAILGAKTMWQTFSFETPSFLKKISHYILKYNTTLRRTVNSDNNIDKMQGLT